MVGWGTEKEELRVSEGQSRGVVISKGLVLEMGWCEWVGGQGPEVGEGGGAGLAPRVLQLVLSQRVVVGADLRGD